MGYTDIWRKKIKGGLSKAHLQGNGKIYLHSVFKGRLKFIGVFRHTVIKPQNTCTTQLASSIVFKCLFPKPSKIRNKSFIIPLL